MVHCLPLTETIATLLEKLSTEHTLSLVRRYLNALIKVGFALLPLPVAHYDGHRCVLVSGLSFHF